MTNSVDPDLGSHGLSLYLNNASKHLQQTTKTDRIFRLIVFLPFKG